MIKIANGQKTGCEEQGNEELFASGLEDRNEEPITMVWETGCDEPIVSGLLVEVPGEVGAEGGRVKRVDRAGME